MTVKDEKVKGALEASLRGFLTQRLGHREKALDVRVVSGGGDHEFCWAAALAVSEDVVAFARAREGALAEDWGGTGEFRTCHVKAHRDFLMCRQSETGFEADHGFVDSSLVCYVAFEKGDPALDLFRRLFVAAAP